MILPLNAELKTILSRIIWFEPPEESIQNPIRVLAYAMAYASHEDMNILLKYYPKERIISILDKIPAGIVDPRSWAYWNLIWGRYPAPSMPQRFF